MPPVGNDVCMTWLDKEYVNHKRMFHVLQIKPFLIFLTQMAETTMMVTVVTTTIGSREKSGK